MTEIRAFSQSDAWAETIKLLKAAPIVSPRGLKVREIPERFTVRIEAPQVGFVDVDGRELNYAILAAEATSLLGQTSIPEAIIDRVSAFAKFTDGGVFWGAYGPRIAGDLEQVVRLLQEDPDTRQAVLSLYDSGRDLRRSVKDVPCTLAIQFFLRHRVETLQDVALVEAALDAGERVHGRLDMWVVMRSNDAWLGLPYDLGQFSILQGAVAAALGARVGSYTHSAGSMHLYESDWVRAAKVGSPREPNSTPPGLKLGGATDIESASRRARRMLLGEGRELDDMSALDRWLTAELD